MARTSAPPLASLDWAFFLDVDGTLVDLGPHPKAVSVDNALLGLVARLHYASGGALALISGRSISDLESLLGSVRIPLAGQHGLERKDSSGRLHTYEMPLDSHHLIRTHLDSLVARFPGLVIEDKGLSLALHYRQIPRLAPWLHRSLGAKFALSSHLQLQKGKMVLEFKPGGFDKGRAIAAFMAEPPFMERRPVFIGDDLTDEYGFFCVNRLHGISIKVGPGATAARHRLSGTEAVRRWLADAIAL